MLVEISILNIVPKCNLRPFLTVHICPALYFAETINQKHVWIKIWCYFCKTNLWWPLTFDKDPKLYFDSKHQISRSCPISKILFHWYFFDTKSIQIGSISAMSLLLCPGHFFAQQLIIGSNVTIIEFLSLGMYSN